MSFFIRACAYQHTPLNAKKEKSKPNTEGSEKAEWATPASANLSGVVQGWVALFKGGTAATGGEAKAGWRVAS